MIIDATGVNVPEGWDKQLLKQCLEKLKSGKYVERGWSPQCLSNPAENTWGVLKTTSVQMGEYLPEYNKELPETLEPKVGLEVNDGDFLVTTTGPRNRCGVVCHVRTTPKKLIFSGKILRFRADENQVLPAFLMYLLMSPSYQKVLDKLKVGTSDSSVSIGNQQILDLEIPLASIEEQGKIVEILEEQISRLDAALASVRSVRKRAARFRRSLLHAAFNGSLTGHETSTGTLPEGWELKELRELVDVLDSMRKPINSKERLDRAGTVPYFGATGQVGTIDKALFDEDLVLLGEDGVQFFDVDTNKAYEISGPSWVNNHAHVLRCRKEKYIQRLLVCYLNQFDYRNYANGTTRLKLTQASMNRIPIVVPPLKVQEKIVEVLEEQISRLDASLVIADAIEMKADALRRSLLHAAFTGELTKEWRDGAHV